MSKIHYYTKMTRKCWVVLTNFGSNMDKPSRWVKFLRYISNPTFGFTFPYLTQIWVKSVINIFRCYIYIHIPITFNSNVH